MKLFPFPQSSVQRRRTELRDVVYVKECRGYVPFPDASSAGQVAIYNLWSGKARTFLDLTRAVVKGLDKPWVDRIIDTAIFDIRDKYQILHWSKNGKVEGDWLREALSFFWRRCHTTSLQNIPGEDVAGQYSWPSTCEWWSFGSLFSPSLSLSKHTSQKECA